MNSVAGFLLSLALLRTPASGRQCVKTGYCTCKFDDGSGTVDLSRIGVKGGGSLVKDVKGELDAYLYSFNPCYSFTEGGCINATGCQLNTHTKRYYKIGDIRVSDFKYDGENVVAFYSWNDGLDIRTTYATFICDQTATTPHVRVIGEIGPAVFSFRVTSSAVCLGNTSVSTPMMPTPGRGGTGSGIYINITNNVNVLGILAGLTAVGIVGALCFLFTKPRVFRYKQVTEA